MTITTWNVNGIRAREAQVLGWIEMDRPDVICLQEIKATPEQVPASLRRLEDYWSRWHGVKGYSGVALLISKKLCSTEPTFSHPAFDMEARIVTAVVGGVTIASVYVPNGGKDFAAKRRFFAALEEYTVELSAAGLPLIVCGDLNVAREEMDVHPKERRAVIGQLPEERVWFSGLLAAGLVDVARTLHPHDEGLFTWWAPWREMRARNIGWRLDYVLASAAPFQTVSSCIVRREVGTSDHAPVVATFN